jgi:acetyl esterase/lipase
MAPENLFPTPADDCYLVTKHIIQNSHEFNADPNRIVLGGDSAGGNIVAVITQRILKENLTSPKIQLLIYPCTQIVNTKLPSIIRYDQTSLIGGTGITISKFASWYLGITNVTKDIDQIFDQNQIFRLIKNEKERERIQGYFDTNKMPAEYKQDLEYYNIHRVDIKSSKIPIDARLAEIFRKLYDPRISPLLADKTDLVGLPKAYFLVLEWDTLKDEGLLYAQRLKEVGIDVTIGFYKNAFHGIVPMTDKIMGYQIARDMQNDLIKYLKLNL